MQQCQSSSRAQRQNRATIVETEDWQHDWVSNEIGRCDFHRCSWVCASSALDGSLLRFHFHQFVLPAFPVCSGISDGCCCQGLLLQKRECHVSLRDIGALCGLFCTGDRWCFVCLGVAYTCTETSGGHGHTTPWDSCLGDVRQACGISFCQGQVRQGGVVFKAPTLDLETH